MAKVGGSVESGKWRLKKKWRNHKRPLVITSIIASPSRRLSEDQQESSEPLLVSVDSNLGLHLGMEKGLI